MESQAALLLSSSSWWWCSSGCGLRLLRPPVVLRFSSLALFSRPPSARSRAAPCRISATLGDEERWLREEQRWLREEQRWLREEARWNAERRLVADELALLKREVEQLRAQVQERRTFSTGAAALPSVVASLKQLVQSLPVEPSMEFVEDEELASPVSPSSQTFRYSEGSSAPGVSPSASTPSMSEFSIDLVTDSPVEAARPTSASFRELRKGAEGEEVRLLQEALEELGFYSGEEDIEYSMFSSGTETAVKAWQASLGVREDGIASPDLLATLFGKSKPTQNASSSGRKFVSRQGEQSDPWRAPSSAAAAASTGSDVGRKRTFAEDMRDAESTQDGGVAPNRRVFLLGENRWEELGRPSSKANGASSSSSSSASTSQLLRGKAVMMCFSCKGQGVMMCTECEGTGDLNVEEQFLDWVEEGAKCPYCEGSSAVPCDVCSGLGAIPQV
jgi:peptidoglycan hydrolase-like protein with peptidoglycan-binding domain